MAELNVEKKHTEDDGRNESQGLARRHTGPSLGRNPSELFSMHPYTLMRRFNEEMDRVVSRAWSGFGDEQMESWSPAVEISEKDGRMVVHADLPGLNKDDVKVEVTDDSLTIQGERKREHEEQGQGFRRSERSYGSFYRSIPLPPGANLDEARAQFNNGVLEVSIPVPEEQRKRRKIPIDAGATERKEPQSQSSSEKRESKAG